MMNHKSDKELSQLIENLRKTFPDVDNLELSSPESQYRAKAEVVRLLFLQTDEKVQKNMRYVVDNFKNEIVPKQIEQIKKELVVQQQLFENVQDMPASVEKVQAFTILASVNHQSEKILKISRSVVDRNLVYLTKKEQQEINEQYHLINKDMTEMKEKLSELRTQILTEEVNSPNSNISASSTPSGLNKPKMK